MRTLSLFANDNLEHRGPYGAKAEQVLRLATDSSYDRVLAKDLL